MDVIEIMNKVLKEFEEETKNTMVSGQCSDYPAYRAKVEAVAEVNRFVAKVKEKAKGNE